MRTSFVGQSVARRDARDKAIGKSRFVADLEFPGREILWGVTVRSPIPRGKLRDIRFEGNIPWKEFTIATAKDIGPGAIGKENCVAHILKDQPCLAAGMINHTEEPVVLLAHPDRYLAEEARKHVKLVIEPLPSVLTIDESISKKEIIWGKDNVFKSFLIEKGDVDSAWARADLVIEGEYSTGGQEQLYIETNGMAAIASPGEGITVWGSMQCPFYVHHALTDMFGLPAEKVRVVQCETGGGFGGKEDYPSVIACHTALLAWKSGKAVKMIYDRAEDLAATTKRHPSRTWHKTGVTRDGRLVAMEIDFSLDGGAYATISSVVLSRGSIHATGPYSCPNVRIRSRAVATNSPPNGAFRGFGAPQSLFAVERHMNKIAGILGMAPDEFRRRNFLQEGSTTATGQLMRERLDLAGLMANAFKSCDYHRKKAEFARHNKTEPFLKKGIGFSVFMHGAGFTGSGEKFLASVAAIEADREGEVRVLASSTEMGQGARTVFTQIVADALGLPLERVRVEVPDTKLVPNSGPTVASRTTMVVGKLLESAAVGLKQTLIQDGFLKDEYDFTAFAKACARYIDAHGALKVSAEYRQPEHIQWDDDAYRGDAYGTFSWGVYVAEVTVDRTTYETRVDHFTAAQEIGRVVNPMLASGQIEGGVTQGIGYALYEEVILKDGHMLNNSMTNYIIPTAMDVPKIDVIFAESPYAYGPSGAKGIGELPLDGVAPAIVNAVEDAAGVAVNSIPMTPERFMAVWKSAHEKRGRHE